MIDLLRTIFGGRYQPLNIITIKSGNLRDNFRFLASIKNGLKIAPVLKSNAYGHGIIEVAKILEPLRPPFFCVDSLYEAYELYKAGIKTRILIMGYVDANNLSVKELPFSYAVSDAETAIAIRKRQPKAGIHAFIDTGMHREGIPMDNLQSELEKMKGTGVRLEGMMSHLAAAGEPENDLTRGQFKAFSEALALARQMDMEPEWKHIYASQGILNDAGYDGLYVGNMARTGLAIYGLGDNRLKPVLAMKSTLAGVKDIKPGDGVGYDFSFVAQKNMKIGIVPAGYHDGVDRRLSSLGSMAVFGKNCRILGKVSMNQTVIDISDIPSARKGDEVMIFSDLPGENSIESAAISCKTIPYDLLVGLDSSTRRIVE